VIRIANDGESIPEEQLPKVFQRFFRGDFARGGSGSGLGLNIAREIAVRHGGTVLVANRDSGGVEFTIELPRP